VALIASRFGFSGPDMPDRHQQPSMIEPLHPGQRGQPPLSAFSTMGDGVDLRVELSRVL